MTEAPISGNPAAPVVNLPAAGAPDAQVSVAATASAALPRTGADLGPLVLLGLLMTAVGGASMLLSVGTPPPVGRHVRPSR